jgi:hypothetical protein
MTTNEIFALTLEIVTITLQWILIPLILVGLIMLGRSLVLRAEEGERRTAARAGWWAGLILFFLFFVHELPAFRAPGPGVESGIGVGVGGVALGTLVGFVVLLALSFLSAARVTGFLVLFLTFAGLASLHSYLFLEDRGDLFVAGTLGMALGGLLHTMVFPGSLFRTGQDPREEGDGSAQQPYRGYREY